MMDALWKTTRHYQIGDEFADYRLLDLVFPGYGTPDTARLDRLFTGTPFGPVDMIPWDTPANRLQGYGLIVHMGANGMDEVQLTALRRYVEQGGTTVLALGQVRVEGGPDRRFVSGPEVSDLLGVTVSSGARERLGPTGVSLNLNGERVSGVVQGIIPVRPRGAEVIAATDDGRPVITRHRLGQGHGLPVRHRVPEPR